MGWMGNVCLNICNLSEFLWAEAQNTTFSLWKMHSCMGRSNQACQNFDGYRIGVDDGLSTAILLTPEGVKQKGDMRCLPMGPGLKEGDLKRKCNHLDQYTV